VRGLSCVLPCRLDCRHRAKSDNADVTFELAVAQVTDGGGGMPAYGDRSDPEHARLLTKEQIEDVAHFVSQE